MSGSNGRAVPARTRSAMYISSNTPTTEQMELSLMMATNSLPSAGRMLRNACGSTMRVMVCPCVSPRLRPASVWPTSTAEMPARMISATYPVELNAMATITAAGNGSSTMPMSGSP